MSRISPLFGGQSHYCRFAAVNGERQRGLVCAHWCIGLCRSREAVKLGTVGVTLVPSWPNNVQRYGGLARRMKIPAGSVQHSASDPIHCPLSCEAGLLRPACGDL